MNIEVIVNNDNRVVAVNRGFAGVQLENNQDSFVVKFTKEFIDGDGYLEYQHNGENYYVEMTKNTDTYSVDVTQILISESGVYPFQVRIQNGDSIFKSQIFYLKIYPSLNAIDSEPAYENWQQWVINYVNEIINNLK